VPWSIRPRLAEALLASAPAARAVILIAEDEITARLAAVDLRETGVADIAWTRQRSWERAGLPVASTPADPADADAIDFLLFVHDRHDGNLAAAQAYLDWETGLIAQCTPAELARFRIDAAPWRAPSPSPDPEARP
jgi:hypothetical protein